jgi:hypothetical protein
VGDRDRSTNGTDLKFVILGPRKPKKIEASVSGRRLTGRLPGPSRNPVVQVAGNYYRRNVTLENTRIDVRQI